MCTAGYFKHGSDGWMHIPVMDYYWRWSLFCNCGLQTLHTFVIPSEMLHSVPPPSMIQQHFYCGNVIHLGWELHDRIKKMFLSLRHCSKAQISTWSVWRILHACCYIYNKKPPAQILNSNLARTKQVFGSPLPSHEMLIHKPFFGVLWNCPVWSRSPGVSQKCYWSQIFPHGPTFPYNCDVCVVCQISAVTLIMF